MKKIPFELFGFPGSGKSFIYKNLYKNNNYITSYENIFFDNFLKKNFISYIYYMFIKLKFNNLSSNYLKGKILIPYKNKFHKFLFYDLNKEIFKHYKIFKKKNFSLFKSFNVLLNETTYSLNYKKKIIKNFNFFCSSYHYCKTYNFNRNKIIINDEGFFQKIFLNYKKRKNKILINKIRKYLNSIPKEIKILNVNTSIKKSIEQCDKRTRYFSYNKNKIFLSFFFPKASKTVLLFCKTNKIKYYNLNSSSNNLKFLKLKK